MNQNPNRRTFLVASAAGLCGTAAAAAGAGRASAAGTASEGVTGGRARSTILFFLCGGSSHIDMWDLKPRAPLEYRGPFESIPTSAPGVRLSEHLPRLARQAHHLSVIRSVSGSVNTNDHHAGYYYNLTGHQADRTFRTMGNNRTPMPDDWPFMGSVVASKRPPRGDLPGAVTLPHKPSRAPYTRPGQFAARLGLEFDPLYVYASHEEPHQFRAPALVLQKEVSLQRLQSRQRLLDQVDEARRQLDASARVQNWERQQARALSLLTSSSTADSFNLASEPAAVRERYGNTANGTSLLMARRLVEAGVPFVTVFWLENTKIRSKCRSAGGWDTHGNNFNCLKDYLLPEFDRGFSALVEDLDDRGLLDETTLLVTSEMGRKPMIGDPRSGGTTGAGRDHWTHCLSAVMAGGGLAGGQTYGSSDRLGEYPADRPVTPAHVVKTVYHSMGIHDLIAQDSSGRPYNLLDEGEPLLELF